MQVASRFTMAQLTCWHATINQRSLGAKSDVDGGTRRGVMAAILRVGAAQPYRSHFHAADDKLFSDFSFRGQLEPAGYTGAIDVIWTDRLDEWNAHFHRGRRT